MNDLGLAGENLVAEYYRQNGYSIIKRNVRFYGFRQIGELDIVATKDKELVFVEVKTRRSNKYGSPRDSVGYLKQMRLRKAAKLFLLKNPDFFDWNWRIDVVEVDIDNPKNPVIIIENAIEDD